MNELKKRSLAVLVVDDSADICALLEFRLKALGHSVTCAATGQEAMDFLHRSYFDLVITDVVMPDGDGLDVINEAKKRYPSTRVVVMSGGGNALDPGHCLDIATAMGANAAILKPFTPEEFLAVLRKVVPESDTSTPFPFGRGNEAGAEQTV
jgi:CheY-like chemotaxis protein